MKEKGDLRRRCLSRNATDVMEQARRDMGEEPSWHKEQHDRNGRDARAPLAEGIMGRLAGHEV